MAQKRSHDRRRQSQPRKLGRSTPMNQLKTLIERDAPLDAGSLLVLMYGPFQAQMSPEAGKGIASWMREQVVRNGFPSLIRFGTYYRAQVFRFDQLQPMLESLVTKV